MKHALYILFVTLLTLASCRTVKYVPLPTVSRDTVRILSHRADTILTRDTFMLDRYRQGDTVYITRNVIRYRDRITYAHDTLYRAKTDTVAVPVEVIKTKTHTPTTMKLAIVILAIVLITLYLHREQNKNG